MSDRFIPKVGQRGTKPYDYFELSLAQGPVGIGVTGENRLVDFIGYAWLLVLAEDRSLHLYRQLETVGSWAEVTTLLPPVFDSPLPEGARRVSFCFDQSARIIVAYELDEVIYVTRWSTAINDYVQNVSVAGVDPVVVFDATWAYDVEVSDVLLFYLDAATRSTLQCRVQRDLYLTEYELHDYGEPVVLDRVARLPLRYGVFASDAVGDPLEVAEARVALLSELYPYPVADSMSGAASGPQSAAYVNVGILYSWADEPVAGAAVGPASGVYTNAVITYADAEAVAVTVAGAASGDYVLVILTYADGDGVAGSVAGPVSAVYELVVLEHEADVETLAATAVGPSGGTYVAA